MCSSVPVPSVQCSVFGRCRSEQMGTAVPYECLNAELLTCRLPALPPWRLLCDIHSDGLLVLVYPVNIRSSLFSVTMHVYFYCYVITRME